MSVSVDPGTALGRAIARADKAFQRRDGSGMDRAYRSAHDLAGHSGLRHDIELDHVGRLWDLEVYDLALRRCAGYLIRYDPCDAELLLLRAEILSSLGRHPAVLSDVATVRNALGQLPATRRARLFRVEGVAIGHDGDLGRGVRLLEEAATLFDAAGDQAGMALVAADLRNTRAWHDVDSAASEIVFGPAPRTVAGRLALAMAYKSQLRYEKALDVVQLIMNQKELDAAIRPRVLLECFLLLVLTRQPDAAQRLLPELVDAAEAVGDIEISAAAGRLSTRDASGEMLAPSRFDQGVQQAIQLTAAGAWARAEQRLSELEPLARTDRDVATWHLAAGELALSRAKGDEESLRTAVRMLERAAETAVSVSLTPVRARALRACGDALFAVSQPGRAMDSWAESYALEERIAELQDSDDCRVRMLAATPDEHDRQIDVLGELEQGDERPETTAAVVVAMEAARGATIVGRIVGGNERSGFARDLPLPTDSAGALRWVRRIRRALPRRQVVWIMHPTPDRIHHALVGARVLRHRSFSWDSAEFLQANDNHMSWWSNPSTLGTSIVNGQFDRSLARIAALIRIREMVAEIPTAVDRIAMVAGRELGDVPLAAVSVRGTTERLADRFALSDLPCLSALLPLRRRAARQRGLKTLLVCPPAEGLTPPVGEPTLKDDGATVEALDAELASHRHRLLRIETHGKHDQRDPGKSRIQLAPAGAAGGLEPDRLRRMDLRTCGTTVLGACESGMTERRGRDERTGFVRAAIVAGAASAVAARWIAHERVAVALLDRFEHYLRWLPRDMALQRAGRDLRAGALEATDVPFFAHPAHWACWTLYGDTGFQARFRWARWLYQAVRRNSP